MFGLCVTEPARFDLPAKNVSTKRGNSATLICHVYGDTPIQVIWTLNGNRLDLDNYRYVIVLISNYTFHLPSATKIGGTILKAYLLHQLLCQVPIKNILERRFAYIS